MDSNYSATENSNIQLYDSMLLQRARTDKQYLSIRMVNEGWDA